MHHISEVHVAFHITLEGNLHRLGDRHGRFTRGQCHSNCARVSAEGDTLGHAGVRITTDNDGPVIYSNVV